MNQEHVQTIVSATESLGRAVALLNEEEQFHEHRAAALQRMYLEQMEEANQVNWPLIVGSGLVGAIIGAFVAIGVELRQKATGSWWK